MPSVRTSLRPNTNKALVPTSYGLQAIRLTNHAGKQADIQDIVVDFTVTESIFMPGLLFRANIKDSANFIEEFELNGQETIEVFLVREEPGNPDPIHVQLKFVVTEYPVYGRNSGSQQNSQAYAISAISTHAYLSHLRYISRALTTTVSGEISRILTKDLSYSRTIDLEASQSKFPGIIPGLSPLDAIQWLSRRALTTVPSPTPSPYYVFETLRGGILGRSLSTLGKGKVYRAYSDFPLFNAAPGTDADYYERASRIVDMSSDFKLGKILPAKNGAWARRNIYIDCLNKAVTVEDYSAGTAAPSLTGQHSSIDTNWKEFALGKEFNQLLSFIPVGSGYNSIVGGKNLSGAQSRSERLDACGQHDITVPGDFLLSPGKIIELKVPKAIDPAVYDGKTVSRDGDSYDKTVSGKYLTTTVVHSFSSSYFCKVRVKRDGINYELSR